MRIKLATFLFTTLSLQAADWPQYLGANANGTTKEIIRSDWSKSEPKILWKKDLGKGCSAFAIADGKALTLGNSGNKDTLWCLEAATGKVIWKDVYDEKLAPKFYTGGPGATPTIHKGKVYSLSKSGRLTCLNLQNGKLIWEKHLAKDFGGKAPSWGYSASPVVYGDSLLVLPCSKKGAMFALDLNTGKTKWNTEDQNRPGYGAPVIVKHQGADTALVFHGRKLVAYNLEKKGDIVFEQNWRTSYDVNASNPLYFDEKVFFASGYGMGYAVIDVSKGKPKMMHKEPDMRLIFQNALQVDGDVIAVFGDKNIKAELSRMNLETGEVKWKTALPGTRGSICRTGDGTLVVLTETGELICGKADEKGFTQHGKKAILPRLCWAPLAISGGKVFARSNGGEAVCVDISK